MNITAKHWINGEWMAPSQAEVLASINPANQNVLGEFSSAGRQLALDAISAARHAFRSTDWAHQPRVRETVLLQYADRLESELPALAALLTAENGKLLAESTGELKATVSELRYYAGLARNIFGRVSEMEPGLFSTLSREPLGVAGIIVPWNAPAVLMVRSLAPALAAGCTAVVKSAPQTALFSAELFRILAEVRELPPGAVNLFTETGSEGAEALVDSVDVDVISYTGSTGIGKRIMAAGAATLKRMNLELGGSAPCIVFEDADLSAAAPALVSAGMFMAGQYCCSATRVLAHNSVLDQTRDALAQAMNKVVVGPGDREGSQMGPLIDEGGRQRVKDLLQSAAKTDEVICGGEALGGELSEGFFLSPALVYAPKPESVVYSEEVFGPVLVLDGFEDEEEAIYKANDTRYGLAASIWSSNLRKSQRVANKVESGTIWINSHGRTFAEIENGGYKESGIGRLHGVEGLAEFMQTKHISWSTER